MGGEDWAMAHAENAAGFHSNIQGDVCHKMHQD